LTNATRKGFTVARRESCKRGLGQTPALRGLLFPAGKGESSQLRVRRLTEIPDCKNQQSAPASQIERKPAESFRWFEVKVPQSSKRPRSALQARKFPFF
jgi:hypothetical protein